MLGYEYAKERPRLFAEDGLRAVLRIHDRVASLLKLAGAARMQEVMANEFGDRWLLLACVDFLVEAGTIREITKPDVPGQFRVFVGAREDA